MFIKTKNIVIIVVSCGDKILLGYRRRGRAINLLDTFSGKIENGETPQKAAIRELKEESGLDATNIINVGQLTFYFEDESLVLNADVFVTTTFKGKEVTTDEMKPVWLNVNKIPYNQCWPNLRMWLPQVLNGEFVQRSFTVYSII